MHYTGNMANEKTQQLVNKKFQGQGIFRKLSKFANSDVNQYVDILYSFPNKKNSLERCKKKKNQIVKDLKNILKNTKLSNEEKDKVQGDKSGKLA